MSLINSFFFNFSTNKQNRNRDLILKYYNECNNLFKDMVRIDEFLIYWNIVTFLNIVYNNI